MKLYKVEIRFMRYGAIPAVACVLAENIVEALRQVRESIANYKLSEAGTITMNLDDERQAVITEFGLLFDDAQPGEQVYWLV